MANLTITVDELTLRRARIRALERGESVNQFLAEQLRSYAGDDQRRATQIRGSKALGELAARVGRGSGGRTWTRDELYDVRRSQ